MLLGSRLALVHELVSGNLVGLLLLIFVNGQLQFHFGLRKFTLQEIIVLVSSILQ